MTTAVAVMPDGRPVAPSSESQITQVAGALGLRLDDLEKAISQIEDPRWLELQKRFARAYDNACLALLSDNDVQSEGSGRSARKFKKKSAWGKLAKHFGVTTRVVGEPRYQEVGDDYVVWVTVESNHWGQTRQAVGACGTDEESGRRSITLADAIATAETRATNRAISNVIAMGEVSYEEIAKRQVAKAAIDEMTLEEAKQFPFPWKTPAKFAGKPMGNLSEIMLRKVRVATMGELEENPDNSKLQEIKRVCDLLIEDIEESDTKAAEAEIRGRKAVPQHDTGYPPNDLKTPEEKYAPAVSQSLREPGEEPDDDEELALDDKRFTKGSTRIQD